MAVLDVFTLAIECGRRPGDGLPTQATGARVLCFAAGPDEAFAVRRAVAVVKDAGFAPLDVTSYGTLAERLERGDIGDDERTVIERAAQEDTVIVSEIAPRFPA
jgi:hypothetical protein